MKISNILSFLFFALIIGVSYQSSAQSALSITTVDWRTDFESAKTEAGTKDKYVMLYFSGSDWCKPCIQLSKNILETETFSSYTRGNFVPVKLDFPKMKKNKHSKHIKMENEALAEKYNPNGVFPLIVFLDKDEEMIGFTGYSDVSPHAYISMIAKILEK